MVGVDSVHSPIFLLFWLAGWLNLMFFINQEVASSGLRLQLQLLPLLVLNPGFNFEPTIKPVSSQRSICTHCPFPNLSNVANIVFLQRSENDDFIQPLRARFPVHPILPPKTCVFLPAMPQWGWKISQHPTLFHPISRFSGRKSISHQKSKKHGPIVATLGIPAGSGIRV